MDLAVALHVDPAFVVAVAVALGVPVVPAGGLVLVLAVDALLLLPLVEKLQTVDAASSDFTETGSGPLANA